MIPEKFVSVNVTDTCAIWHLVGAPTLFRAARQVTVSFVITSTVFYECFVKSRGRKPTVQREEMRKRLRTYIDQGQVSRMNLEIDDLQDVITLARQRGCDKRLGQGELSCAALARRLGKAVLTDNKRDFTAIDGLADGRLHTTPRLLAWLYVKGHITDSDVEHVRTEHQKSGGQMSQIYKRAHYEACEKRLAYQVRPTETGRG